ncbi:MAG TPA: phosphoribosylformylglycinamidine synthase subunit PurL [Methanomassiliicoccales archaeon]|nr:phosphoribosylformylglycinamidine synthase subunit PurL [Methanomassiliicoccales archaeon]
MPLEHLFFKRDVPFSLYEIALGKASDDELKALSNEMGLSLSLEEMQRIRDYFVRLKRRPTDVEVESIAQAWSEHCCYKSSKVFLREHIFGIDNDRVLARGDAGVMVFDDEYGYALRIESHNHPSAIEPYGGAATGIGGIVRDVLCMGAQPVALIDPLFFGPIDHKGALPAGSKTPKYLVSGVVGGIRDYGNRIGIPTVCGGLFFDESYLGNCLVNVGCVGIVKREDLRDNAVGGVGDHLILCGGRTGRDGIHGVTFASAELSSVSEDESRGAVQLGDPITKEPLIHACLEVNSQGLINGMKDLGGGGLSCVVGEMALSGGCGAEVQLDTVPLKESGLAPWEVWVSESQERMMLAASEKNVKRILDLFAMWDVEATVVGKVVPGNEVTLFWQDSQIFQVDLDFLTKGPEYCRPFKVDVRSSTVKHIVPKLPSIDRIIIDLLSDPNIASKEWVFRMYDHEVRGGTVVKPATGIMNKSGPSDATVIKPLPDRERGLALAVGVNPWFCGLDAYRGGMASVDEACRNIIAVGGYPDSLTDCLNFGNPEKPERLGEFKQAVTGIGKVASYLDLPIPSGNVSLYNETARGSVLPTPTVLGLGIIEDVRECVTTDLKKKGNLLYQVGETKEEFGGSALYRRYGGQGGEVPDVSPEVLKRSMDQLHECMKKGLIASCHDISDGGMAVTVAEMCLGGDIGADIHIYMTTKELFSESNTRWVVEIEPFEEKEFLKIMTVPVKKLGKVGGRDLTVSTETEKFSISLDEMRNAWSGTLGKLMG